MDDMRWSCQIQPNPSNTYSQQKHCAGLIILETYIYRPPVLGNNFGNPSGMTAWSNTICDRKLGEDNLAVNDFHCMGPCTRLRLKDKRDILALAKLVHWPHLPAPHVRAMYLEMQTSDGVKAFQAPSLGGDMHHNLCHWRAFRHDSNQGVLHCSGVNVSRL